MQTFAKLLGAEFEETPGEFFPPQPSTPDPECNVGSRPVGAGTSRAEWRRRPAATARLRRSSTFFSTH